jgi:hypothetical protein
MMSKLQRFLPRPLLALVPLAMLLLLAQGSNFAYTNQANFQIGFAGTGVAAGTGVGFGFWGWCALGGNGSEGDCQFSQYFHSPAGGFTCEESLDISAWDGSGGTFVITGTATARPAAAAAACLANFPGSASFSGVDTGIPSAPGHYNLGGLGPGLAGEFQIQVSQLR